MSERQKRLRAEARKIMDRRGISWDAAFRIAKEQHAPPKRRKPKSRPKPKAAPVVVRTVRDYQHRDQMLRELGYGTYANYLKSETWHRIRLEVLKRADWTCYLCGDRAQVAHHSSYTKASLTGENTNPIYAICHKCHRKTHFQDGKHRDLKDAVEDFGYTHAGYDEVQQIRSQSRPRGGGGSRAPSSPGTSARKGR